MSWSLHEGEALRRLREMDADSVDAVITDPPYSSGGLYRGDRASGTSGKYVQGGTDIDGHHDFAGDNRDQRTFLLWCNLWLAECWRVAKPGAAIAVFCDWRQYPVTSDAMQVAGWVWRGTMVWDKTRACRPQLGRPRAQAEFILWGSKGPMPLERDAPVIDGVVPHRQDSDDKHHQTGKPTPVMRHVVQICERGGTVLDPFAGSGTTGVAALLEGRSFVGIEMSPAYAEVARRRLEAADRGCVIGFQSQEEQAVLFAGGEREEAAK